MRSPASPLIPCPAGAFTGTGSVVGRLSMPVTPVSLAGLCRGTARLTETRWARRPSLGPGPEAGEGNFEYRTPCPLVRPAVPVAQMHVSPADGVEKRVGEVRFPGAVGQLEAAVRGTRAQGRAERVEEAERLPGDVPDPLARQVEHVVGNGEQLEVPVADVAERTERHPQPVGAAARVGDRGPQRVA